MFSAAHFITLENNLCERLHGHNYQVAVEVFGPLNENQYVIDFIAMRDTLAGIIAELDHRMLLPTEHPHIRVQADDKSVEVSFQERRWVFPRSDCVLLPVSNTTAEKLAEHIGRRLLDELERRHDVRPAAIARGSRRMLRANRRVRTGRPVIIVPLCSSGNRSSLPRPRPISLTALSHRWLAAHITSAFTDEIDQHGQLYEPAQSRYLASKPACRTRRSNFYRDSIPSRCRPLRPN